MLLTVYVLVLYNAVYTCMLLPLFIAKPAVILTGKYSSYTPPTHPPNLAGYTVQGTST